MQRKSLSLLALGGVAIAGMALSRRKRGVSVSAAPATVGRWVTDIGIATDVIDEAEKRRGFPRFAWSIQQKLVHAARARRRLSPLLERDSEVTTATAQPGTTIPLEQQPGGGPPHR